MQNGEGDAKWGEGCKMGRRGVGRALNISLKDERHLLYIRHFPSTPPVSSNFHDDSARRDENNLST